mmetsp:Transcript_32974/g.52832  ORF Transcript_32974/g.52832 Transcript_32974/m.52832 type:complete len:347 (-) Transcript_32974:856-1896(-)
MVGWRGRSAPPGADAAEVCKRQPHSQGHIQASKPSRLYCGLVALSYMLCAVTLLFFNKAALSAYSFPNANVITLAQLCCANTLLYTLRKCRAISFTDDVSLIPRDCFNGRTGFPTLKMFRRLAPLSCAYMAYMLLSMASVRGVNLPMYTTLRRTTAAFTMTAEYLLAGQTQPREVVLSVAMMVAGAGIAGAGDFHFDLAGYVYVFANNAATAVYLACITRFGRSSGLNSFGMMWCNGVMAAPVLFIGTAISGELASVMAFPRIHEASFQAVLICSCVLAFALNYAIFLNTSLNSALTQTICGNLKDIVVIAVGYRSFGGVTFAPLNFFGIAVGSAGSLTYAYLKLR